MFKDVFCYFSRGTNLQKLSTAKLNNGFLVNNQIWEAQGPWFLEIYVCKSPQGGGGFRYLACGLFVCLLVCCNANLLCKCTVCKMVNVCIPYINNNLKNHTLLYLLLMLFQNS